MNQTANLQQTIDSVLQQSLSSNSLESSILLWTNLNPKNSFILKKDGKRYLGLPRKDKKGENYWKFKEIGSARPALEKKDQKNANNSNSPE